MITEQEIKDIISTINYKDKPLSEQAIIEGVSDTSGLLKIRLLIEKLPNEDKKIVRQSVEDAFAERDIDVLVSIVNQGSDKNSHREGVTSQVKPFLEEMVIKRFKKIIAVYSSKGGVGKSTVAVELALEFSKKGYKTAMVDLDIYGPSVPRILGIRQKIEIQGNNFIPAEVQGIHMMSVGLLIPDVDSPLIWRAPIANGVVAQIFSDTLWDDFYDVLVIDLPPGTGDIPIMAGQSLAIDGVLAVSTPQGVALEDTVKGLSMFRKFDIPLLGLVYNMGSVICPDCQKVIPIYPQSQEFSDLMMEYLIDIIADLPMDPQVSALADLGRMSEIAEDSVWKQEFNKITENLIQNFLKK